jgi:CBS domain-containing protein
MSTIRDLTRGRKSHSLQASESVMTAACYMTQCHIGAIPVMDGERLASVFSERDILTRVVAAKRNPDLT